MIGKIVPQKYRNNIHKLLWHLRNGTLLIKIKSKIIQVKTKSNEHPVNGPSVTGNIHLLGHFIQRNKEINKHNILIFPVIDWHYRIQRPQHLARGLAEKGNQVIYFCTTFHFAETPGFSVQEQPCKNVLVVQLNLNKKDISIYNDSLSKADIAFLLHSIYLLNQVCGFDKTCSVVDLPFWTNVVVSLKANHIVYDCMDYHAGFHTNSDEMLNDEDLLLRTADLVITSAQTLSDRIKEKRDNVIIRNAAEVKLFAEKDSRVLLAHEKTTIGYYGAIANWFDVNLVKKAALALPELDFVLIGEVTTELNGLNRLDNVTLVGEVPYSDLTAYLNSVDVCLIPFKIIELTLCTNPVKVYEYLAAGKPVVATAMPEVELISGYLHIGYNDEAFIDKIKQAVSEVGNETLAAQRSAWALTQDWSARALQFHEALDRLGGTQKKVSLVVLTFNNLALTKECLHSILNNTRYQNYEIIVVDNNSTDGTQNYLRENYADFSHIKLIFNEDNLGFAKGNNIGIQAAVGDIVVVINNDTYVSPYWLEALVGALDRYPELGLVCPVTNNIGNEAKINISYDNFAEMETQALSYACKHDKEIYPLQVAAFFCVAIKREVLSQVGLISEDYGLGFFEDDDYCERVRANGWKIAAVEDAFVHHHLSASFNKLKEQKKQQLMKENQAIFESKWGVWKPHQYRDGVH